MFLHEVFNQTESERSFLFPKSIGFSALFHIALLLGGAFLMRNLQPEELVFTPIKVELSTPPMVENPQEVEPPKQVIREDKRVKPRELMPKPEIRGGVSDSLRKTPSTSSIGVAEGNSATMEVDPNAANRPPPSALPDAVMESVADVPARCPVPPELQLTDAAVNAGITSGRIVIDVMVNLDGSILVPKLLEGIGYGVDELALKAANKLICQPAIVGGNKVPVKNKRLVWKVVY